MRFNRMHQQQQRKKNYSGWCSIGQLFKYAMVALMLGMFYLFFNIFELYSGGGVTIPATAEEAAELLPAASSGEADISLAALGLTPRYQYHKKSKGSGKVNFLYEKSFVTSEFDGEDLSALLESDINNPIIVIFYAPWCGHCQKFVPRFEGAAYEVHNHMKLRGIPRWDPTSTIAFGSPIKKSQGIGNMKSNNKNDNGNSRSLLAAAEVLQEQEETTAGKGAAVNSVAAVTTGTENSKSSSSAIIATTPSSSSSSATSSTGTASINGNDDHPILAGIAFAAVNCVAYNEVCKAFKVKGYPAIMGFKFPTAKGSLPVIPSVDLYVAAEQKDVNTGDNSNSGKKKKKNDDGGGFVGGMEGEVIPSSPDHIINFAMDNYLVRVPTLYDTLEGGSSGPSGGAIQGEETNALVLVDAAQRVNSVYTAKTQALARTASAAARFRDALSSFYFLLSNELPSDVFLSEIQGLLSFIRILHRCMPDPTAHPSFTEDIAIVKNLFNEVKLLDKKAREAAAKSEKEAAEKTAVARREYEAAVAEAESAGDRISSSSKTDAIHEPKVFSAVTSTFSTHDLRNQLPEKVLDGKLTWKKCGVVSNLGNGESESESDSESSSSSRSRSQTGWLSVFSQNAVGKGWKPHSSIQKARRRPTAASSGASTGYTCGLWLLFHYVTIASESANVNAVQVMEAIFAMVNNFFGCDNCRSNFAAGYKACSFDRCTTITKASDHKALQLWLFNFHNAASLRINTNLVESVLNQSMPNAVTATTSDRSNGRYNSLRGQSAIPAVTTTVAGDNNIHATDTVNSLRLSIVWPNTRECASCMAMATTQQSEQQQYTVMPDLHVGSTSSSISWNNKSVIDYLRESYELTL